MIADNEIRSKVSPFSMRQNEGETYYGIIWKTTCKYSRMGAV